MLRALIQHPGEPLSKRELLERVFSDEQDVNPEAIEVLVHRLRKRYGELLRLEVAETLRDGRDVEDEIRDLFDALKDPRES